MSSVCIQEPCLIHGREHLLVGDHVHIGRHTEIMADGGVTIGNNVVISFNCVLWSIDHQYNADRLPYGFARIKRPIIIKDNVWICRNVLIRGGVTIGEGAVIGMGSVVTGDVPPLAVVAGNPAQVKKFRDVRRYMAAKRSGRTLWQHGDKCGACMSNDFYLLDSTKDKPMARHFFTLPLFVHRLINNLYFYLLGRQ